MGVIVEMRLKVWWANEDPEEAVDSCGMANSVKQWERFGLQSWNEKLRIFIESRSWRELDG
jgi:hypothetical protein